MAIIVPSSELIRTLTDRVGRSLTFHLFKNDISPTSETPLGDFVEADFSGYAPIVVPPEAWYAAVYSGSTTGAIVNTMSTIAWEATAYSPSPVIIYGLYVTNEDTDLVLVWSDRFDGQVADMSLLGSTLVALPQMQEISFVP